MKRIACLLVVAISASGCIAPIPHSRRVSPVFTGRFVHGNTQRPLADIPVSVHGHPKTTVRSDANGDFKVGPASRFKWGYLWTPALVHDLPGPCVEFERRIEIRDPRFQLADPFPEFGPQYPSPSNGVVHLGILKVKEGEVQQKH